MQARGSRSDVMRALESVIATYGADRTRWPAPDRLRFASLLAESAEARRLLAEAAALDRLLDGAPAFQESRCGGLAERIVAAALAEPRQARRRTLQSPSAQRWSGARRAAGSAGGWAPAAMLAASLALGIFAGTSGYAEEAVPSLTAALSSDSAEMELDATEIALDGYGGGDFEEELL